MNRMLVGSIVCLSLLGALPSASSADEPSVLLYTARELAGAKPGGLQNVPKGSWRAWAWQRGGAEVTWTLAGRKPAPASAKCGKEEFAWVRLGEVAVGDGPVSVKYTPASAKPADAAVGALALARSRDFDPARLWLMTRVYPAFARSCGDARPKRCRHIKTRYSMPAYASRPAWEKRAAWLREHVRVSSGLLPEPRRTPLRPRIFGKIEREGYTIEKAFFESRPGFYVCGNLYRPRGGGKKGPHPAVASPHGHWREGRFGHEPPRGSVPARCITLARLGYVVFAYDMVGYNDSARQIPSHRGIFNKPACALWGLSVMHLQSWNTIRVLDFLQHLPDVDPERLALTGCSGGGTQTFMVMGIEPRLTAAAPVCMISGIMQGGCECENAPLLRIETNNIEIGALMAPRPMIMPSVTGDWTKETPKVEYPGIRGVYELYGAAGRVVNVHVESPHGYNKTHRQWVYNFFERWVRGRKGHPTSRPASAATQPAPGKPAKGKWITEPPYKVEKKEDLLVWAGRQLPKDAKTPRTIKSHVIAECRRQRDRLLPKSRDDLPGFHKTLGAVYRHAILAELPPPAAVVAKEVGRSTVGRLRVTRLLLGRKDAGDRVPALLYRPATAAKNPPAVLLVHPEGKAALIDRATGSPGDMLAAALAKGCAVLAIDTYLTGEFHSPFAITKPKTERCFETYNRTELVQRIQDVLTALAYLRRRPDVGRVELIGPGRAGAWCLLAAPFLPADVRIACDLARLAGDDDPRWEKDLYTPLILKAGAPYSAVAMAAPRHLLLYNLAEPLDTTRLRAAYSAAGGGSLRLQHRPPGPKAVVNWLHNRTGS